MSNRFSRAMATADAVRRARPTPTSWLYRGEFPLDRLAAGQSVRSAGDGTEACEVGSDADGWVRYDVGDHIPYPKPGS